jgi:hypothetical protein
MPRAAAVTATFDGSSKNFFWVSGMLKIAT